jgi:hypothetical protein
MNAEPFQKLMAELEGLTAEQRQQVLEHVGRNSVFAYCAA